LEEESFHAPLIKELVYYSLEILGGGITRTLTNLDAASVLDIGLMIACEFDDVGYDLFVQCAVGMKL